jgi:hypothetical protein
MSANATNPSAVPGDLPGAVDPSLSERAEQFVARLERSAAEVWHFFRFVLFVLFLLLLALTIWLWLFSLILSLVRFVLHTIAFVFLSLSGGMPPRPGQPLGVVEGWRFDAQQMWASRTAAYEALSRPLARHLVGAQYVGRMFWHWSWFHKGVALVALFLTVFVPAMYVVPRPHNVQITDDNAIDHNSRTNKTRYLVHALDLDSPGKTREYLNEDAWYLGKINSQGLKSQLQNGRTYRLWVVGVRWYYMPRLYPNIISATEINEKGEEVTTPRRLAAPPQAPAIQ